MNWQRKRNPFRFWTRNTCSLNIRNENFKTFTTSFRRPDGFNLFQKSTHRTEWEKDDDDKKLGGLITAAKEAFEARGIKVKAAEEAKDEEASKALKVDLTSANLQELNFMFMLPGVM